MTVFEFNEKYLMGRPRKDYGDGTMPDLDFLDPHVIPMIVCRDGFKVSVQASRTHYCTPRYNSGPWYQVELGFPSEGDVRLNEYMDFYSSDPDELPDPTDQVYGYVPLDIVLAIFEDHGGIDESMTKRWNEPKQIEGS